MHGLQLNILGGFELLLDGRKLPVGGTKQKALLAYLALQQGRPVARRILADLFWGDRFEQQARRSLRQALFRLNKALAAAGVDILLVSDETAALAIDNLSVDALDFQAAAEAKGMVESAATIPPYNLLLDGISLTNAGFEEWLARERGRLQELACTIYDQLSAVHKTDQPKFALAAAEAWIGLDKLDEAAHRRAMEIELARGDRVAVLRRFMALKGLLARELGIEPSSKTKALAAAARTVETVHESPLPLPEKPSIAVLPFENMSGDSAHDDFADGVAEEITTALSRFRSLFVIARTSSFTYKGCAVDIAQIARDLGVRYVVEGSFRKAGNRVRITAQLVEAASGNHLWADRFDGELGDIFDLQDKITERIVGVVEPEIAAHERERARRKPPEHLDAWELVQRGLSHFFLPSRENIAIASSLFQNAIEVDPNFAMAHAYLADAYFTAALWALDDDRASTAARAKAAAMKAVNLDPNDQMAHYALGRQYTFGGEAEAAIGEMKASIKINPNYARGYYGLGLAYFIAAGEADEAIKYFDVGLRLSPRDPSYQFTLLMKGSAHRHLGRFEEAIAMCGRACQIPGSEHICQVNLAAALAEGGRLAEARIAADEALNLEPTRTIGFFTRIFPSMHEDVLARWISGLRKAGFPE